MRNALLIEYSGKSDHAIEKTIHKSIGAIGKIAQIISRNLGLLVRFRIIATQKKTVVATGQKIDPLVERSASPAPPGKKNIGSEVK